MATATQQSPKAQPRANHDELLEIPIGLIDPNPNSPRENWDSQQIDRLVPSICRFGLVQPAIVRALKTAAGQRFELVAGERRLRAAKEAGELTISCIVRTISDEDALAQTLIENLGRKALSPLETARMLKKLCTPCKLRGAGLTRKSAAALFGKPLNWGASLLLLLKLPEAWQQKLARGEIELMQARLLIAHRDSPEFLNIVERDMLKNPWAWRTKEDVDRSIKQLLVDWSIEGGADQPHAARAAQSLKAALSKPRGDAICAAIARLSDVRELSRVETATRKRRQQLRPAGKPSKTK